jgi:MoxR-like ATPase
MKQEKDISKVVENCYRLKPERLIMDELKWKYLVRSALRGKNTLILGPAGQGKTLAVQCLSEALGDKHPFFYINLGSTQDPRATLIGNTHFNKESGTYFQSSPFIKAITTPNSIVLLDELSRAHPDAANILLTVLDYNQRYLRLDEKDGSVITVASGVAFIATANVGNEYTNTRVMDRALLDRFTVKIEVDQLEPDDEKKLINLLHPNHNETVMGQVIEISNITRSYAKEGKVNKGVSTRSVVEMAELTVDGFSLEELAEMVIYPDYPNDGGVDSERTMVKQVVQKYIVMEQLPKKMVPSVGDVESDNPPF